MPGSTGAPSRKVARRRRQAPPTRLEHATDKQLRRRLQLKNERCWVGTLKNSSRSSSSGDPGGNVYLYFVNKDQYFLQDNKLAKKVKFRVGRAELRHRVFTVRHRKAGDGYVVTDRLEDATPGSLIRQLNVDEFDVLKRFLMANDKILKLSACAAHRNEGQLPQFWDTEAGQSTSDPLAARSSIRFQLEIYQLRESVKEILKLVLLKRRVDREMNATKTGNRVR
ncbi:hypothetical protein Forpe1208_v012150 [Fusarium oxysporum f. sp. rapae]|uniref:Uncharacterized protein n=1 Tax=Fusarium oxysporum f. sp. rapae TaxID=485398 RepID=A0A8J5TPU2_FUSOX|nr:hypothetical protein Forpe1208_v012136 [Fusarium oxysporum f. sp. rapae]KAG7408774.1 hypothetical protein Forpe1208_v012150 [Fusarium oxysporum f. sp. rapae]